MTKEQYPLVLKPKHVAEILGVSLPSAYEYMRHTDFPSFKLHGSVRVMRDKLFDWLESQSETA